MATLHRAYLGDVPVHEEPESTAWDAVMTSIALCALQPLLGLPLAPDACLFDRHAHDTGT